MIGASSHVHRGFRGKLESSNVSRDNVSREIGRNDNDNNTIMIMIILIIVITIVIVLVIVIEI